MADHHGLEEVCRDGRGETETRSRPLASVAEIYWLFIGFTSEINRLAVVLSIS